MGQDLTCKGCEHYEWVTLDESEYTWEGLCEWDMVIPHMVHLDYGSDWLFIHKLSMGVVFEGAK